MIMGVKKRIKLKMVDILFNYWQKKIKIIDDRVLYKIIHLIGMLLIIGLTILCNILFLNNKDYILFFILNLFLVIYNKPTILANIQRKRNVVFLLNIQSRKRFVTFEILKENPLIIVAIISNLITIVYSLFSNRFIEMFAIILLIINCYLLEIYQKYHKVMLLVLIGFMVASLFGEYRIFILLLIGINIVYLFNTFYQQLLESIYSNKYNTVFISRYRIDIYRVPLLYFLRMPLDKLIEILLEILLLGVMLYFFDIGIVIYTAIAIFTVDMELLQDEKLKEFDIFYGKRNFMELTKLSKIKMYFFSLEFNHAIQCMFLLFWIFCIQIFKNGSEFKTILMSINLTLLVLGISYRFYATTDIILKNRTDVRRTWFRLVMLYLILFNMTPFIFLSTLEAIEGYSIIYGFIFSFFIDLILFIVKIEKITGVLGNER